MKIAVVQGIIPHYREEFFLELSKIHDIDIYLYEKSNKNSSKNMKLSSIEVKELNSKIIKNKLIYFDFIHLLKNYKTIILPANMRLISVWIILILGKFLNKKIILWGHGISVKNYLNEEKKLNPIRVFFHKLASHIWLYTEKEKSIWSKYINSFRVTALNNSIDTSKIINLPKLDKIYLKKMYNINTKINLIYCARFTQNRRIDLMLELIEKVKDKDIGFIIIGEGDYKPDFNKFKNVHDFGAIYEDAIKHELFTIADFYYQPAWTGLSIVEAMAFQKPIITFKRSKDILQCVEYDYIINKYNGFIVNTNEEIIEIILKIDDEEITLLRKNCKETVLNKLNINQMVKNALKSFSL